MSSPAAPVSGIVVVDKPSGWTSHDVVGRLRRLAGTRKVGHAGTLDPMATGVLVLGVNRATRLLGHLALTEKEYAATIRLGEATSTDDAEGEVIGSGPAGRLDRSAIESARDAFVGDIEQVPSSVSAVKVAGRRAYARVRAGEEVTLAPRQVHVGRFDVGDLRPSGDVVDVDVTVTCSSGTYIRALARDLGSALGVGGHLTALRRTRVGAFAIDRAHTLEQLAVELDVVSLSQVARSSFPVADLPPHQAALVRHGRALADHDLGAHGPVAVFDTDGEFLALYEQRGVDARAVAVFTG
ncbi:MAG: tRNA pseudouridine(55) synthase TruB [Nocardioidaceae bacterium]